MFSFQTKVVIGLALMIAAARADNKQVAGEQAPAQKEFEVAYQRLIQADEAYEQHKWAEAARLYREALESYERFSLAYPDWQPDIVKFRIAYCASQLDDLKRLRDLPSETWQSSVSNKEATGSFITGGRPEGSPESVSLAPVTAARLVDSGNVEQARAVLLEALRAAPDDVDVRLMMGLVQCRASNYADAVMLLQPLVEECPTDALAHLVLATALFGLGELREAAEETRRALQINPDLAEAHFNLAQILVASQPAALEEARQHYQRALELGVAPDPDLAARLQ